jgi:hypothetical protein
MDKQDNYKPVADIIATIKKEEENQTNAWKAIAEELFNLKNTYGFQSDQGQEVITAIGYSKSKISKLAKIGGDSRLSHPLFKSVSEWSVLYDVCGLNDEQLEELKKQLQNEPKLNLTSELIKSIKYPSIEPNIIMEAIRATLKVTANEGAPLFIRNGKIRCKSQRALESTILVEINLENQIENDVSLINAKPFLQAYDSMTSPQVEFGEKEIIVTDDDSEAWVCVPNNGEETSLKSEYERVYLEKDVDKTDVKLKTWLEESTLSYILKMASILNTKHLAISTDGERVSGVLFDTHKSDAYKYQFDMGATDSEVGVVYNIDTLRRLTIGNYSIEIMEGGLGQFERANCEYNPVYYVNPAYYVNPTNLCYNSQSILNTILGRETEPRKATDADKFFDELNRSIELAA